MYNNCQSKFLYNISELTHESLKTFSRSSVLNLFFYTYYCNFFFFFKHTKKTLFCFQNPVFVGFFFLFRSSFFMINVNLTQTLYASFSTMCARFLKKKKFFFIRSTNSYYFLFFSIVLAAGCVTWWWFSLVNHVVKKSSVRIIEANFVYESCIYYYYYFLSIKKFKKNIH